MDEYDMVNEHQREMSLYREWTIAVGALQHVNKLRAEHEATGCTAKECRRRHDRLQDIAIRQEQDCYSRWVRACNELDQRLRRKGVI